MESEVLRVKHDISNTQEFESVAVYFDCWYLTLTVSNNCACNATRHEGELIKTEL